MDASQTHRHTSWDRLSRESEAVEVVARYGDDEVAGPGVIGLTVSTWRGPKDDAPDAVQFREHVTQFRDTLWVEYLAPVGEPLVQTTH